MIEAELHDGTILEFPDGTPDDIVQSTVKKHLGIGAAPAAPSAPAAPALALPEQPAKQSALADLADSDTGVEKVAAPKGPAFADTAVGRTVTGALESATRGLRSVLEPRRGNRGPQHIGIPNRPVLPDVATQTAGLFEAPKESYADLEARNPQDARWSAVLASLPERARASLGKTFADSQRLLGSYEAQLSNLEASLGTDFEKRYPNNPNAQEMRRLRDEIAVLKMVSAQFEGDTKAATPKNETLPQKALGSLAESAFPTVAAIAAGAATRSPALAMLLGGGGGGVMEASSTYAEAIDKGATPQVATRAGILNGILEGVGEAIPLGIALRPGSPLRARVWNVIGAEAGQEVATQVMQDLNNKLSFDPNMRFDEAVDNALVAAMSGAMGGAVYGGVGAALQKAAEQPSKEMVPAPPPLRPVTPALDAALADKPAVRALVQSPYAEPAFAQGAVQGPMTAPSTATGAPVAPIGALAAQPTAADAQPALPPTGDGTRSAPVVVTAPEHLEQAEQQVNTEPTDAQKEAGNYQKAHVQYQGFNVTIENPKGSTRSGTAPDGTAWSVEMPATYGYIKRTEGADGDQVDVYLGGNPAAPRVWIVDQIDPATGKFDEAKVLMGFDSREEALKTYEAGFSDGKGAQRAGAVTEMAVEQFREWVDKGDTKAPLAYKPKAAPTTRPAGERRGALPDWAPVPTGWRTKWRTLQIEPGKWRVAGLQNANPISPSFATEAEAEAWADGEWTARQAPREKAPAAPKSTSASENPNPSESDAEPKPAKPALNLIQTPTGKWLFAGNVPDALAFKEGATAEQIANAKKFGERFGPGKRLFDTREEGVAAAEAEGHTVHEGGANPKAPAPAQPATENQPDSRETKFKPGDIVDARPGRTIPKATVVRSFFKKMNGFDDPVEAVEIETPDGRRLQLLALEVKPWQADADSTSPEPSPKPSPKPSPSAADAASVSADDFDALINEVQAERKQPEAPKAERWEGYEVVPSTTPGEMLVREPNRDGYQNLATFRMANGRAVKVKQFFESQQTRGSVQKAIDRYVQQQAQPAAQPAPASKKPPRTPKVKAKVTADQQTDPRLPMLREHFAIGNVIRSAYWRDHDRVIAFDEGNDRMGWSVTVQKVEKKGDEWVPVAGERPRVHSTMPSPKDEIVDRVGQAEPTTTAEQPGQNGPEPNANAPLKQAAQHAAEGVKEGFAGLDALFGRKGTLGSGPAFDEETWAKAKPHFEAAFREFVAAGKSLKEFVRYILDTYNDAVVPYLKRWHADHVKALDEQPQTTGTTGDRPLEGTPSQDAREPATGGDAGVDSTAGGRDDAAGSGDAGGAGLPAGSGMGDGQGAVRVPPGGEGQQPGTGDQRGVRDGGGDQSRPEQSGDAGGRAGVGLQHVPSTEDYRITDLTRLGEGGQKTKYRDNVAAIRLLKDLEATGRRASQDEQNTLARYVGWGGISQAFDPDNTSWTKEFAELRSLLTDEEYDQARRSTRYAHYTSQQIIVDGIYAALQRFGFAGGGKMLEPGGGVGNFIGLMPEGVRTGSRFTLVEREPIAAGIAKHLYPQQSVILQDFTEFNAANGYYDVVAGNPPFARTALTDMSGRKHLTGMSIHNYFLAKSVDLLRPGGVLAVVVSNYFMDAAGDRARQYIGERTRFLGAIRLPNNAFSRNALTEVTTDLIFLQKLPEKEWGGQAAKKAAAVWLDTGTKVDPLGGAPMPLNAYFIAHPEMMLGRMERSGTMYGPGQPALVAVPGQDTGALLRAAVAKLPADVYKSAAEQNTKAATDDLIEALESPEVHEGGYFVRDGKLYERVDDVAGEARARVISPETRWSEKQLLGQSRYERLIKLANLRQTLRKLIALEMEDAPKVQISTLRQRLNAQYDAYVKAHGLLNDRGTLSLFGDDPDYPLIAALEHNFDPGVGKAAAERQGIKPVPATAKKAPIFDRRVIEPRREVRSAETPADALVISLAERGRIDTALIGKLLARDGEEVLRELAQGDKPLLFLDPATQEYTLRDAYLSGNVRLKLAQAQAAGMGQNARALEEVIPEDVPAHEIGARVGSPWIPTDVYEQFARELLGDGTTARVRYVRANASFLTTFHAGSEVADGTTYGTDRASASDILTALMNNREIKVYDTTSDDRRVLNMEATEAAQDKARAIKDRFEDWVFSDPDRADKLARVYNDTMNNYVTRRFDGAMLTFPGKVPDSVIKFRRHQRDAIARIVQDRTALLDHVVGAGKTFTIVAGAMELKRTGLARKPLIAVPNHLVKQWAADFYRLYPGANILTATKKDFERQNRRKFLGRVATGNWDAVIIAHSSFGFIRPDPGFEEQFNAKQIANIVAAIADLKGEKSTQSRRTVKQLEALKERLEQRIKRLRDKPVDDLLDYGQLGVDQLFVDEAHLFKNLMFITKMQNVRGLGQPDGSQRAYDMYLKTQHTMARNGRGQGVVFATGTPISNSLGEMYHMLRYLAPDTLSDLGHDTFDAWANTFAEVEQVWMQSLTGQGYKSTNRLGKFANAPELLRIFDQVADTVTIEDIKKAYAEENEGREFPIPALKGGRRQPVSIPISAEQKAFMGKIAERAVTMQQRKGPPKKGDDNMLSIMTDARKAAMDVRLVEPSIVDRDPKGRIAIAAGNIVERYRKYADVRGTQLVFSDMGTPIRHAKKELVEYQELQEKLAPASDEDIKARAELGDEAAIAKLAEAEAAAAAIEAKGMDWLDAVKAALRGFSIYDDLRSALIEQGIPAEEIAFIHDYNTDDQKAALFRAVNAGKIRVLMGSTEKMGAGTNVQERAVALHHLDVPWKPSDVEQREGRIIRQGNKLPDEIPGFEVEVMAYATQDTLDLFMWQTQEKKLAMIGQLRTRKVGREIENSFEEMQMSAGEMQAAATSNPYLLEEIQLKDRVKRLERQQRQFDAQKSEIAAKKRKAKEQLERLPRQIADAKRFAVGASAYMESIEKANAEMKATVAGNEVVGRDKIGEAIISVLNSFTVPAKVEEKATDAEHEKALADAKKATAKAIKEKGVEFNGTVYRSQTAVSEAYREFAGDRDPIRVTIDGKTVTRRSEAGQMIEKRVAQAMRTDEDVDVGALGKIRITAETGRDGFDRQHFVVTVSFDGVDLNGTVHQSDQMSRADVGAAIVGRAHDLVQGSRSSASWLESDLARAERTLRDIEANQMDGDWAERDALAQARAQHQEVLKKLATFGKDPAQQTTGEDQDPKLSRAGEDDVRFAANALTELAATDEVFRYPVSKSSDLDAVMAEVVPDVEPLGNATRPEEERDSGADRRFMFRTAAGHDFYVYERGRDVWIDVSALEQGEGGSAIYAVVLNYAHNAKKRLIGDPKGLSVDAIIRRTSAMLSSALRFGTTRHMAAAPEQMAGDPEARIAPLKWGSNDAENVRSLIDAFLETLYARVPDLKGMRYDFGRQQFVESDGSRVRQEDFERLAKEAGPRDARAGEGTLRRGVLLQSLVSSQAGQRPGILQAVLSRAATLAREGDLRGILSRRSTTETPADAGVSASVARVAEELEARMGRPADALGVKIVPTWKDLPNGRASFIESRGAYDVQGMFDPDTGETYLVAANIVPGRAFAVYLHELGVHKGLRDLLGPQRFTALASQIKTWSRGVGTEEEVRLAKIAAARIPKGTPTAVADEELIAYFVETAVNAGHDIPQSRPQKGRLAQWLHDLWAAVRTALAKLDVTPETLTAAEVVTLARGAAERATNGLHMSKTTKEKTGRNRYDYTRSSNEGGRIELTFAETDIVPDNETDRYFSADLGGYEGPSGTGSATAMYLEMLEDIRDMKGFGFRSDSIRSDEAQRLYDRLRKAGIPFRKGFDGMVDYLTAADLKKIDFAAVRAKLGASSAPAIDQTESAAFKRWFQGSKVVDAKGAPITVYHATPKSFSKFIPGGKDAKVSGPVIWMTPNKEHQPAAHNIKRVPGEKFRAYGPKMFSPGTNVMPLYANIKNPLLTTEGTWKDDFKPFGGGSPWVLTAEEVSAIKAAGHDGIFYRDKSGDLVEVIAFEPTQVKSAIGNRGTFDPNDPSILRSMAARQPAAQSSQQIEERIKAMIAEEMRLSDEVDAAYEAGDQNADALDAKLAVLRATIDDMTGQLESDLESSETEEVGLEEELAGTWHDWKFQTFQGRGWSEQDLADRIRSILENNGTGWQRTDGVTNEQALAIAEDAWQARTDRGARIRAAKERTMQDPLLSRAGFRQVQQAVSDLFRTDKTFNWWHRTVGTQYHKATIDPDLGGKESSFARVFHIGQDYLQDVNYYSAVAEEEAPDLLLRLETPGDLFLRHRISAKNARAIASPIFEGTLNDTVWTDAELRQRYSLTDKQIDFYRQFRAATDRSLDEMAKSQLGKMARAIGIDRAGVESLRKRGLSLADFQQEIAGMIRLREQVLQTQANGMPVGSPERAQKEERVASLKKQRTATTKLYNRVAKLKRDGYAPLMRFGKYTVDVVDAAGDRQFFGMYETQFGANRAARQMATAFPGSTITTGILSREQYRAFQGLTPETVDIFGRVTGLADDALFQEYLRMAVNNRSALKRLIHRKEIPGFSEDVTRVLASFITSNARLTAANFHAGDMLKATVEIPKAKGDVRDEAEKLRRHLTDPQEEGAMVRGWLFATYLGGSVAAALVNLTQPVMMTAPHLTQYANAARVAAEMAKASMEGATGRVGMDVRGAYDRAKEEGVVAPHEIYQLMAEARGRVVDRWAVTHRLTRFWGGMFSLAEAFNRRVTFIAAYRIGVHNRMADPYRFAVKVVQETQGIYNKGNRPNWARGTVGATVFTFKQFSIAYLEWWKRLPPKQKLLVFVMLYVVAGLQGLPFADDIEDLIDAMGQWLGYGTNSKKWLRQHAARILGEDGAQFVLHGISAGLPLDISTRLGLGNLIPGTELLKRSETQKGDDLAEVAGPLGGVVGNLIQGKFKEALLPKAYRDGEAAWKMWVTEEYRVGKNLIADDVTAEEAAIKGIGFNPSRIATKGRVARENMQDINLIKSVKAQVLNDWTQALLERHQGSEGWEKRLRAAQKDLKDWNTKNPEMQIRIEAKDIRARMRELQTLREDRITKTAPKSIRKGVAEDLRK